MNLVTTAASWAALWARPVTTGALVISVLPGSGAAKAGIVPGEVLTAVDGNAVTDGPRATALLRASRGARHALSMSGADGRDRTVEVTLGDLPTSQASDLKRRLADGPDIATRYLYAGVAAPEEGLKVADFLVASAPDFAPGHAMRAQKLLQLAERSPDGQVTPGSAAAAVAAAARAVELEPASADVQVMAAEIHLALGAQAAAEAAARAAVEVAPDMARAHFVLGAVRMNLGQPQAALPDLSRAVALDPFDGRAYELLAEAYGAAGERRLAEATMAARQALSPPPPSHANGVDWKVGVATAVVLAATGGASLMAHRRKAWHEERDDDPTAPLP